MSLLRLFVLSSSGPSTTITGWARVPPQPRDGDSKVIKLLTGTENKRSPHIERSCTCAPLVEGWYGMYGQCRDVFPRTVSICDRHKRKEVFRLSLTWEMAKGWRCGEGNKHRGRETQSAPCQWKYSQSNMDQMNEPKVPDCVYVPAVWTNATHSETDPLLTVMTSSPCDERSVCPAAVTVVQSN